MAKPFEEALYTKLYQLFSSVGVGLNVPQMERLQGISKELADLISKESTSRAIEFLGRVKDDILNVIKDIESKVYELEQKVDKNKNNADNLIENKGVH